MFNLPWYVIFLCTSCLIGAYIYFVVYLLQFSYMKMIAFLYPNWIIRNVMHSIETHNLFLIVTFILSSAFNLIKKNNTPSQCHLTFQCRKILYTLQTLEPPLWRQKNVCMHVDVSLFLSIFYATWKHLWVL